MLAPPAVRRSDGTPTAPVTTLTCEASMAAVCGGHVDVLAESRPRPLAQRDQRGAGGDGGGLANAWGTTRRTGGRSPSPVSTSEPLAAMTVRSVAGHAAFGPVLPERADRDVDQRGVGGGQRGVAQAQPLELARRRRVEHHVRAGHEAEEPLPVSGLLEVEHDRALARL